MSTLKRVADRIEHEVGLPRATSIRIVKRLNALAKTVRWARPVEDGHWIRGKLGRTAGGSNTAVRNLAVRKSLPQAVRKRRS